MGVCARFFCAPVSSAVHAMSRGALLVFEGCDRVGKSTQCSRLVEALNAAGKKCHHMHFPDRSTAIGKQCDLYLRKKVELPDHAVHLLFSANRWELEPEMRDMLTSGTTIVVDRYAYSGVAYTAAKKVAPLSWCKAPDVGIPRPDRVFYLELSALAAEKRAIYGEERYELVSFQQQVENQYEELKGEEWQTLDASRDIESLHAEIYKEALRVVDNANLPIRSLWTEQD